MVKQDSNKTFKFSIITAVYNTEEYLAECIESVLNQTIGLGNIQLILVDDGSTDSSLKICLNYQEKYPKNIIVLEKENGGQASARNLGLKYATGEYLNFLDSDDKFELNCLEKVDLFYKKYDDVDIVSIPIRFFEAEEGPHLLNFKYDKTKVVDLLVDYKNPQLSFSSSFVKKEAFSGFNFDTRLVNSEDALVLNKILLKTCKLGLIHNTTYYYRKRLSESSTIDKSQFKKGFFNDRLKYFFKELIDYSLDNFKMNLNNSEFEDKIPKFIQYMLSYDLQWIVSAPDIKGILDEEEQKEFWKLFFEVLSYISMDVIENNEVIRDDYKTFLLTIKNIQITDASLINDDYYFYNFLNDNSYYLCSDNKLMLKIDDDVNFVYDNFIIDKLSNHNLWLDIVSIRNGYLNISGYYSGIFNMKNVSVVIIKESNGQEELYIAKGIKYPNRPIETKFLSINWKFRYDFDVKIPLKPNENCKIKFRFNYSYDGKSTSIELPIDFEFSARLSRFSNYYIKDSQMIIFENNMLNIVNKSYFKMLKNEIKSVYRILNHRGPYYTSAAVFHIVYIILYLFMKNRKIWLFMDRRDSADDNAEALFKYAIKQNDGIKKYFTVNKDSPDYERLSKFIIANDSKFSLISSNLKEELISFYSIKQRLIYLFADKVISSHPDDTIINPFAGTNVNYYSGLITSDTYFLQHGVTKDDISGWLSKFDKDLSLILTTSDLESESFLSEGYHYDEEIIQALGFPRFDYLENKVKDFDLEYIPNDLESKNHNKDLKPKNPKKQIVFMPSWRKELLRNKKSLLDSEYFKRLNDFINNDNLIQYVKEKGYEFVFKPHRNLYEFIDLFDTDNIIVDYDTTYRDIFNESSLLITDYSSVAFDFAYLKKPIIYYQYANDYNFDLDKSYFKYETMGFGKVVKHEDELVSKVIEYLENNCKMEDIYKNRVDSFYKYVDKNNSKRVYEWILNH